jgi:hypothetical protein
VIDAKGPLKGKGGSLAQWEADASQRLQAVYLEMEQLAQESKSVLSRSFALYVYGLRSGKQLRWRMTAGRHATWADVEPLLQTVPQGLAQWYVQAEEIAQILNHREQVIRYELKTVQRLMQVGPRASRQYRGNVGRGLGGGRTKKLELGNTPNSDDS